MDVRHDKVLVEEIATGAVRRVVNGGLRNGLRERVERLRTLPASTEVLGPLLGVLRRSPEQLDWRSITELVLLDVSIAAQALRIANSPLFARSRPVRSAAAAVLCLGTQRVVVSYADFITLLFAFFVVLYASAQVDKRHVGKLAMAIQVAFQELGVFDTSNTKIPLSDTEAVPFAEIQAVENAERTGDLTKTVQPMKGVLAPASNGAPLKDVQEELEKALAPEIQKRTVDVRMTKEGLVVSLREMGFYESGAATMRESSMGAINRLARILASRTESIRIEGHTDNVPIHNAHFASNWELSTSRATELAKLFIDRFRISPLRLAVAGYAEYHPVASNTTEDGRKRNRRVDLVILNPPTATFAAAALPGLQLRRVPGATRSGADGSNPGLARPNASRICNQNKGFSLEDLEQGMHHGFPPFPES